MTNTARKLRVVEKTDQPASNRLREAFPEINFDKIIDRGTYNRHNLYEKWDSLVRQLEWWLKL